MFYTCTSNCTNPAHKHGTVRSAAATKTTAKARATRPVARKSGQASKVVDLHCHYLNPEVNAKILPHNPAQYDPSTVFANELTRAVNVKQMQTRAPKLTGVTQRLKDMDRMGVDIQAVCPAPFQFCYWAEADFGAQLSREVNEGLAKIAADHPDRFVAMGNVPLQNSQLAIRELNYCVKKLGMRGIEICTNVNGKNLTDPSLKARVDHLASLVAAAFLQEYREIFTIAAAMCALAALIMLATMSAPRREAAPETGR